MQRAWQCSAEACQLVRALASCKPHGAQRCMRPVPVRLCVQRWGPGGALLKRGTWHTFRQQAGMGAHGDWDDHGAIGCRAYQNRFGWAVSGSSSNNLITIIMRLKHICLHAGLDSLDMADAVLASKLEMTKITPADPAGVVDDVLHTRSTLGGLAAGERPALSPLEKTHNASVASTEDEGICGVRAFHLGTCITWVTCTDDRISAPHVLGSTLHRRASKVLLFTQARLLQSLDVPHPLMTAARGDFPAQ